MPEQALIEKVDRLEEIMMQVAYEHTKTEMELRSLSKEMKAFKQEMSDFKQEMWKSKKENDRRWGDLVNKLGTLVEDIVAPSLPRIVREDFGVPEIDDFMVTRRVRDKKQGSVAEFDCLIIAGDTVFINETKSKPKREHVDAFLEKIERLPEFFPDFADKKIVPLFASMYIPEEIVHYLTGHAIYALGMGEDVMEVLNMEVIGTL
ncbi:MAG: hypothetical protein K9K79_00815 [Desulfohalobiaceae bacterium]|nr:hypothetical protein [Desulfohalobiaceae bacterium]